MSNVPAASVQLVAQFRQAIATGKRPQDILYTYLNSGSPASRYIGNTIALNPDLIKTIASPEGREWVKKNIDGFLDYLVQYVYYAARVAAQQQPGGTQ